MKVLQIHNAYQLKGGEDIVVEAERALLSFCGNDIFTYYLNNNGIDSTYQRIKSAIGACYSATSRETIECEIKRIKPDIVHVHNFFPLLTPSIYDACIETGVPVIQTLHNFRTICPSALLMRNGKPCEECIQGSPYRAVLYGCYRDSRVGSLAVARMVSYHRQKNTWDSKVDRFIALSEFSMSKFVEAGFPADKIAVKPNFYDMKSEYNSSPLRHGGVFVGRLSYEKGIDVLLKAYQILSSPLKVVGDGPLFEAASRECPPSVELVGKKNSEDVSQEMMKASFMVLPSICYENFPMTIAEAFAHGLPVICSRLGAMAEIVDDGVTGLHFEAGNADDLAEKVRWAEAHPKEMKIMRENARAVYEEKYTPDVNYEQLMDIYEQVISENKLITGSGMSY